MAFEQGSGERKDATMTSQLRDGLERDIKLYQEGREAAHQLTSPSSDSAASNGSATCTARRSLETPGAHDVGDGNDSDEWSDRDEDEVHRLPEEIKCQFGKVVWVKRTKNPLFKYSYPMPAMVWDPRFLDGCEIPTYVVKAALSTLGESHLVRLYDTKRTFFTACYGDISQFDEAELPAHLETINANCDLRRKNQRAQELKDATQKAVEASLLTRLERLTNMRQVGRHGPFQVFNNHKALLRAARVGDAKAITSLIAAGADLNFPPETGGPHTMPLHLAVEGNHAEALRALLKAGADTERLDDDGETPLHLAVKGGAVEALNILLEEANAHVGAIVQYGFTALEIPVGGKVDLKIVQALLSAGADPNHLAEICDNGAYTPLRLAVDSDCVEAINILISGGANPNRPFYTRQLEGVTPVHWACRLLRPDCLEALLRRGGDPSLKEGGGVSLSDYMARPTGLKASDVVGADNPCEKSTGGVANPAVQERILVALETARNRRKALATALVMMRALHAREPERAVFNFSEEEHQKPREMALEALQVVWKWNRIASEDRRELYATVKHNETLARKQGALVHVLNKRSLLESRNFQVNDVMAQQVRARLQEECVRLQKEYDDYVSAREDHFLDEIGIRRRAARNKQLRQAANQGCRWVVDLERGDIVERLTRGGSLPDAAFEMVMAYV